MKSASSLVAGRMFTWLAYLGARRCLGAGRRLAILGTMERLSAREVERTARHDDERLEEQDPVEEQRRLVVQQCLPPVLGDELGEDNRHDRVAARRSAPDLLQQRRAEVA